jgi:hypothetical protein
LSQQYFELFRGARDDCALAANHDWALHQFGMLEQERDDRLLVGVVTGIQAEFLEALVLADQVGGRVVERFDYFLELLAGRMIFQIIDEVELDLAGAKKIKRAT